MSFFPSLSGSKSRRPEASSLDRKRTRRKFEDGEENDEDSDEAEEMYQQTAAFLGKSVKPKVKDPDDEDGSSDEDALDGEDDGMKEVTNKPRDRSKYFNAQLSKQGQFFLCFKCLF